MLLLVVRFVFEETWLTLGDGPQMVAYSFAHGSYALLILAPFLLVARLLVSCAAIVLALVQGKQSWKILLPTAAAAVFLLAVISLPPPFWQWLFIGTFARSPHAPDLITSVAAEGYTRTVRGYLDRGVPVDARGYQGASAAFIASAKGNLLALKLLASRGADLNATDLYGDSPLQIAIEHHAWAAADFLRQHGANQRYRGATPGSNPRHRE